MMAPSLKNTGILLMLSLFSLCFGMEKESVLVRSITEDDISPLLALDRRVSFEYFKPIFLQYPDRSIGQDTDKILEDELIGDKKIFTQAAKGEGDHQVYVATGKKTLLGFGIFSMADRSMVIDLVLVQKEYRGQGVGKKIVDELFAIPGILSYRLAVIKKNESASRFWRALGFKLLEAKPEDMGNDYPADCADLYDYYRLSR